MQHKETIYIDVEDDITSIIGKIKSAKEKTVALVPPKRTGVLQSAVNLRLLTRAAETADKRLIIVTHNTALAGLAAAADIPVAKTLQSQPELKKPIEQDEPDEDIIEGSQLPVGDHADTVDSSADAADDISIDGIEIDGDIVPLKKNQSTSIKASESAAKQKNSIKVPDFGSFRKRLALGFAGGVAVISFLYWALAVAPQATIVVTARTTDQELSIPVSLGSSLMTNPDTATMKSVKQTEKTTQTVDFNATGTKDVGEKAKGEVIFSTDSASLIAQNATIPAGTNLITSSGLVFITTSSVTFTLTNFNGAKASIVAAASGTKYNGASGLLSGAPAKVLAEINDATAGGTEKIIKVVSQADVDKAQQQFTDNNQNDVKKKLKAKFPTGSVLVDSSFLAGDTKLTSLPAVGQEAADGKAKLTTETSYSMVGVAKDELDTYLDAVFKKTLSNKNEQRIYDNGLATVKFDDYKAGDKTDTASLTASAKIGPKINENNIKQEVKGKRAGEIIGDLKAIDGVSDVEVKLSPFWVQGVPDDIKKISIEFKLKNNG